MTDSSLDKGILTVGELLLDRSLAIPVYQRPYKWTTAHVHQLLGDLLTHRHKEAYRLGTLVFHRETEDGRRYIVDGQQRTVTLMLIVQALIQEHLEGHRLERNDLKVRLAELKTALAAFDHDFDNPLSQRNIRNNYLDIARFVARPECDEDLVAFLLERCQLVTFTLGDISEAFQFFDSQNARGRDLDPHDLLKAFHLRAFSLQDEPLKARTVSGWENTDSGELVTLFAQYLYRIRQWVKGRSARYFSKEDCALFKGINMDEVAHYPYVEGLRITHHFVDNYNRHYARNIDGQRMAFPFSLDQIILNGRRFFEMIAHYQLTGFHKGGLTLKAESLGGCRLSETAACITEVLNTYEGRQRTGDRYVRMMFDCLLVYYLDKFGTAELSRAIEKIFIWAYTLRLRLQSVHLASVDNHVLQNNLFALLRDATAPEALLDYPLPMLRRPDPRWNPAPGLLALFEKMHYVE
ncbi:DUF262 domain-containing protein [Zoogloea sp.]|uniref:DUF262 domain-containing protein n=1 Tax=Zoogloea sp. TaxID=49181 RepID=UPI002608A203|nr:DUF262 domain-containing protein [Zoogloea sp.]MDD3353279.1 DUF262 domain-containing protein [Zoogloea sp.]